MRWLFTPRKAEDDVAISDGIAVPPEIRFTFKLFHELVRRDPSANIFFSPWSVMLCLVMVYDGARRDTRSGMASALELAGLDVEGVAKVVSRLRSVLQARQEGVQLLISNSLWWNQSIQMDPAFATRAHDIYDADVREIDFAAADAVDRVNGWVSQKTTGTIPRMVDSLHPLTLLVALNAIYFKGLWKQSFLRDWTRDRAFATGSGKEKILPRMLQRGRFQYWEQPEFQAVILPYQGARIAMYILLPARKSSLRELQDLLSAGRWELGTKKFAVTLGVVHLPRFRMSYETGLRAALVELGMEQAFDQERADFAGIRNPPPAVWIDEVLHRAVAEVDEEGTEAAAVTATVMRALSTRRPPPPEREFELIVDRPFLFMIRDETSGDILFMGSVVDPSS
jgi:serine protease inhibitor